MLIFPIGVVGIVICKKIYDRTDKDSMLKGVSASLMIAAFHAMLRTQGIILLRFVFGRFGREVPSNILTELLSSIVLTGVSSAAAYHVCEELGS